MYMLVLYFVVLLSTVWYYSIDDKDDSGIIDAAEVILMTKDVYGRNIDSNPYTKG